MGEIALKQPGVRARGRLPGPVDQRLHQQLELRHRVRHAEALRRAQGRRPERRRDRRQLNQQFAAIQDAFIVDVPAAAGAGPRHDRRLQAAARGPRRRSATRRSTGASRPSWRRRTRRPSSPACSPATRSTCRSSTPTSTARKARQLGVPVTDVFDTMQIYLGSLYVNDFNKFGRTYSVRVQADAPFRARAEDIGQLKVRSNTRRDGAALGADEGAADASGPSARCATTASSRPTSTAAPAPGYLVGPGAGRDRAHRRRDAAARHRLRVDRAHLPGDPRRQLRGAGCSRSAILLVFLVLAAQYESLALPLAIILIVPMALLAAMTGVWLTHGDNNIFTQIGLDRAGRACVRRTRS